MARKLKEYIVNPITLVAEIKEEAETKWWKFLIVAVLGMGLFLLYMISNASNPATDLPKTAILKRQNADWSTRTARISRKLDTYEQTLSLLQVRDDKIYRSVYGLDEIPKALRESGFRGENRYDALEGTALKDIVERMDILEKQAYIQSKSFDDVMILQRSAGDMAAHIPAISPINTDRKTYRLSSTFGYRSDPLNGRRKRHTGLDFACPVGNPIYVTGDGVVTKVAHERKGYGNHVIVDHGFGYRTRYAHLSQIDVQVGDKLSRGDYIGLTGKSGRITGPHLHYEILYRKDYVNPALYMDLDLSPEDYFAIAKKPQK